MEKKIAMILDDYFPPDQRVEREALALIAEGYQVHLWAFSHDKEQAQINHHGVHVHYYHPSKLVIKASAVANDFPLYHEMLRNPLQSFLDALQPEVVHIHDILIAGLVLSLKKEWRVTLDLHENRPEIMRYYPHLHRFPGKFLISPDRWKRKEEDFVRKSDAVVVVTRESRAQYAHLNSQIAVVPNVVDLEEIQGITIDEGIKQRFRDHVNVVYVGDLGRRRGIEDALKATALLKDKIPNFKLILVGKSSDQPIYDALVQELKLQDYVSFEGFQPHGLLFSYISVSILGISPLWRNPHHDTTYANKIFQYMAMGVPQVVSDCPSQANVVRENNTGLVHKALDPKDLADKILQLFENKNLQSQLSQNSKQAVEEKLNWDLQKQELLALYQRLT